MNDRYLYRAKRTNNGEWEIGSLIYLPNGEYEIANKCTNTPDSDPMWGKCVITHKVDPYTICQCTGLRDKNGKLIWENDIVKRVNRRNGRYIFREQPSMNCKVVWTYNYGFDTLPSCGYFDKSDGLECEVIGNIFDNPELLGVGL